MKKKLPHRWFLRSENLQKLMSLLVLLWLGVSPLQAAQGVLDAQVSIQCHGCSLKSVLMQLEQKMSAKFIYSEADIQGILVNATYDRVTGSRILDDILGTNNLSYKVMNGRVVIKRKTPPQTGGLKGKVYDADSHSDVLIGATVRIEGTGLGTTVSVDGTFEFREVPVGVYTVVVSFVGYQTRRLQEVKVLQNNTSVIEIPLNQSSTELGEVVVRGNIPVQFAPIQNSTEISLMSEIQRSNVVLTGISSQQITRSLDRDAADVMQRVPGVNLMNNFVLIRGMSQRYTMTYINGMMAPSTEADQRAFSFNLLPSGLIDNILVYKSPAPELRGGFAGGLVNVSTKQSNTARRIQIGFSAQYRPGSSYADGYTNSGSSASDWWGGGLEDREYDRRLYDPSYLFPDKNPYALRDLTLNFPKPYDLKKKKTDFDKRLGINYYDSWKIGNARLNNLTSLNYTTQSQFVTGYTNGNSIPQNDIEGAEREELDFEGVDSLYRENLRISALQTLGLKINDHHRLEFTGFYNHTVDDRTNIRDKNEYVTNDNFNRTREVNYEYTVQDLYTVQLGGQHTLGAHEIDWRVGKNFSSSATPDLQSHTFDVADATISSGTYQIRGTGDAVLRRGSVFTEEDGTSYGLDYRVKLWDKYLVKAGAMHQSQERSFESWYYYLAYSNPGGSDIYSTGTIEAPWYQLSDIVNDSLVIDPDDVNGDGFTGGTYIGRDYSEGLFRAVNDYTAVYIGTELPINKKLQVNVGMRYECYSRKLFDELDRELITTYGYDRKTGLPVGDTLTSGPVNEYWLPSASLNWNISDDMRITTSYGKTIDRPAYRESAPFAYYDFEINSRIFGDAGLQDATIHNYDLRWEYYPTPGEFLAVGVFYKDMENIIELTDRTNTSFQSGNRYLYFVNSPEATVKGIELEARKNLGFIPWKPMQYFSIIANYAVMKNEVKVLELDSTSAEVPADGKPRVFVGAAPYVFNASLYFEQPEWGTTFSVLVNSIGQRMIAAGGPRVSPIYEQGRTTLDLVLQQRITPSLTLKAGVQNLLNTKIVQYRDQNMDGKFDEGKIQEVNYYGLDTRYGFDYITREYETGSYYSLGLKLEF
ncbi:TonB-dependent receptor [Reichenbachiella sp. MSK19-1]|uniref:TonB-dependent receptor n=1 Tax=Reichenbachiella sp. MSK19-1 TaxID=1897631 RepID=UPI000E6D47F8|nr:TonB-dependent receptor [Reichenbachiella sp. MSK19-1]